LNQKH
jgi:hypothetical protein